MKKNEKPRETDHYSITIHESDRANWLATRGETCGASEVPSILGVPGAFSSALAVQTAKWITRGVLPATPSDADEDSDMQRWGRKLEPLILEHLAEEIRRPVRRFGWGLRSKRWPWLSCTPDGLAASVVAGEVDDFVQAKNSLRVATWNVDENGRLEPMRVWVQVQAEMAVTGDDACLVAALCSGFDFKWARIKRDAEYIESVIVPKTREFMAAVESLDPLPSDFSEASRFALQRLYPQSDPALTLALPASFLDIDAQHQAATAWEKAAGQLRDECRNKIREAMGTAQTGTLPDGVEWTWKTAKNGVRTLRRSDKWQR